VGQDAKGPIQVKAVGKALDDCIQEVLGKKSSLAGDEQGKGNGGERWR